MDTSNAGDNHAVLHAQNDMWGLGPIETINSGYNVAVLNAQNHRWGLGHLRLSILVLKLLFWMQKTIGEVWDT